MAITKINKSWIGLSGDNKPTYAQQVKPFTMFTETDTGKTFIYTYTSADTLAWREFTLVALPG